LSVLKFELNGLKIHKIKCLKEKAYKVQMKYELQISKRRGKN